MIPIWAQDWYNEKAAQGLTPASLYRYSHDLVILNMDISKSSVLEIKARLATCSTIYGRGTLRHVCIAVKQVLRQLGRDDDAKAIKLPKRPEARVVTYSPSDVQTILMSGCANLRDRLLIEILDEIGLRRGELFNMRIKDVRFDEYSAIIWLHGKTGTRTRRVYGCLVDIHRYLQQHPDRSNGEAKFWLNKYNQPLAYQGIYKIIHRIGYRSLHRNIYPHGFRHTSATRDVKSYTDREMMIRYGWSRPDMVTVYAHLTGRDVDEKDLALHGFHISQDAPELLVSSSHVLNESKQVILAHCLRERKRTAMHRPETPQTQAVVRCPINVNEIQ
jgi:integrase/recombinase XerD